MAVLLPVYQNLTGIELSLDSISCAKHPCEIITIAVDDGSVPALTLDLNRYRNIGLTILRLTHNQGIEAALNCGLKLAESLNVSYVARLDAGDTIAPERLVKQMLLLETRPDIVIVGSRVRFVNEYGVEQFIFTPPDSDRGIRRRMHLSNSLIHPAVMIRMAALNGGDSYGTGYPAAEDYELFFRLLGKGKAASIPESLTVTMLASKGISLQNRRRQLISRLRIQLRYFEWRFIESYLGIAATICFLAIPAGVVGRIKRVVGKIPV